MGALGDGMSLTDWFRRLFRSDSEDRAARDRSREDRLRAKHEAEAAKTEAAAHAQQFPRIPGP